MDYQSIKQNAKEIGVSLESALAKRRKYIEIQINYYRGHIRTSHNYPGSTELEQGLTQKEIQRNIKEIKHWKWQLTKLNPDWNKDGKEINRETIARAKAYPIANLLPDPVRHNRTNCPFHSGGVSSGTMSVKNNFAYCFHCNESWDTIELAMKLQGLTFREAVLTLTGANNE